MTRARALLLSALAAAAVAVVPARANAAEGSLDASFGTGGTVLTPIGTANDFGAGVAVDSQDRVVVAGRTVGASQTEFALARYATNGTLDDGFGFHGIATSVLGPSGDDDGTAVTVDSQGRPVMVGRSLNGAHYQFGVARFTATGQADTSFNGGSGIETTPVGPGTANPTAVATDSQDRIVVAGTSFNGTSNVFTVVRYNAAGGVDTSFGGGIVTTPFGTMNADARAVTIDSEGRIIVAGEVTTSANDDVVVARYTTDGTLDPSFGNGAGFKITSIGPGDDSGDAVAVDPQGRIVVAGATTANLTDELAVVRYLQDGTPDPYFGTGGTVTTPIGDAANGAAVAIDRQGRPVVGGGARLGSTQDFAVARYRTNGTLDPAFGSGGIVTTTVGTGSTVGAADGLAIDSRSRIVAAGTANNGSNTDFAVARYVGDQTPPQLTVSSGPRNNAFTNDSTPSFGFTSAEAGTTFTCRLDAASAPCSSPYTAPRLPDGSHAFALTGTDTAGNTSQPLTRTFTVDTKLPRVRIKGRTTISTSKMKARAHFSIKVMEPVHLQCKLDSRRLRPCRTRYQTPKLGPGHHKLKVRATDRAGNRTRKATRFRIVRSRP